VHPDDKKNLRLVGKQAKVPLFNFYVPILKDERVDPTKGTGIVMCCTFGDLTDIDWFRAHKLPLKTAIDESGRLTGLAGKYAGLSIKEARAAIVEDMKQAKLVVKQTPIKHIVKFHDCHKCEIEFRMTKQWFIRYLDLRGQMLALGKKVRWHPAHMINRYNNWVKGLQWDWCISRQRYYGIPIPVWYCKKCKQPIFAEEGQLPVNPLADKPTKSCACGSKEFEPEKDVLDTWATSSLTPLINAHWEENADAWFKKIYPLTLRANAHEIITFWDFYSMFIDWMHTGKLPFTDIMVSGHGLDAKGNKMAKSLGNIVRPFEIVDKYCADAQRYWAAGAKLGDDLKYNEGDVAKGMQLLIKLWNVARFMAPHIKKPSAYKPTAIDKWMLHKLNETIKTSTEEFNEYEYSKAKHATETFFWNMCDYYVEMVKYRLFNNVEKESAQQTLYILLDNLLKLFAPFVPFITEELHNNLIDSKTSIHVSGWPEYDKKYVDKKTYELGELACQIIGELRKWKKEKFGGLGNEVESLTITHPQAKDLAKIKADIAGTMRIKKLEIKKGKFGISD
jgi:valyl-tRNA synthetase